jgi:hypothetical protein
MKFADDTGHSIQVRIDTVKYMPNCLSSIKKQGKTTRTISAEQVAYASRNGEYPLAMRNIEYMVSNGIEDAHVGKIPARRADLTLACVRDIIHVAATRTHIKSSVIRIATGNHLFNFMNDNGAEIWLSSFHFSNVFCKNVLQKRPERLLFRKEQDVLLVVADDVSAIYR